MPVTKDMMLSQEGAPIAVGDTVSTRFRGGERVGKVEAIVKDEEDIEKVRQELGVDVRRPPKVVFFDQHGCKCAHNASTLSVVSENAAE